MIISRLLFLVPLAVLIVSSACSSRSKISLIDETTKTSHAPTFNAQDAEIIQTGVNGQRQYQIRAANIYQKFDDGEISLTQLELQFTDDQSRVWKLSAEHGSMPQNTKGILFKGNVKLQGTVELGTEQLSFNYMTRIAYTPTTVHLNISGQSLGAAAMQANLKTGQIKLESKVNGHFTP